MKNLLRKGISYTFYWGGKMFDPRGQVRTSAMDDMLEAARRDNGHFQLDQGRLLTRPSEEADKDKDK